MALGTLGSTLNDELNRLANGGTYRDMNQMVDEALAAKQWANRENINPYSTDTVGILNEIAGLGLDKKNWLDFNGVCNYIAGTTGLPAAAALRQVYPTTDLLTGVASYYVDGYAGSNYIPTTASGYMYLPGVVGNAATAPDSSALDITGDIDLRVKVAFDNWRPAADCTIIAKWATNNASWALNLNSSGNLVWFWSGNGTSITNAPSTTPITFDPGTTSWVRVVHDVDNGSGGSWIYFYTSTDGTNWTQLGTTVLGAVSSFFSGTGTLDVGRLGTNINPCRGKFYRAQAYASINGTDLRFDANFETAMTSQTVASFTESSSNAATVTINRNTYNFQLDTINNLGAAGSLLPTTLGSSTAADSNDPKFLDFTGTNYVYLPGTNNDYLTIPNSSPLQITGDLDLRAFVAMDDWSPSIEAGVIGKWTSVGNQRSYALAVATNGTLILYWSTDGTVSTTRSSTVGTGIVDGTAKWVRATLDVDNGASGHDVRFFLSDDGTNWTQLGTTVTTAGVTSIFASTANANIGAFTPGSSGAFAGKVFRGQIFAGLTGTDKRLDVDTSVITAGSATSFTAVTGQTVTINRSTSGRKTVAVTQPTWLFGTDDYMEVNNRYMSSGTYLYLPGVASNYASAPDSAALDITGDIDIRCKVALDDWTPSGVVNQLVSKWTSSGNLSYQFRVTSAGLLEYGWTPDGTTQTFSTSSVAPTITDGSTLWVRVTHDVNNGSSQNVVQFFTSPDGTTWTQLGTTVTNAGVTSIYNSNAILEIGTRGTGTNPARGKFFRAQVLNGINGTVAFDANFETSITSLNQTSFTESSANAATVTINRSGSAYRSAGITTAGYLYPGATNTFAASATGHFELSATDSLTAIAVARQWNTPTSFGRYFSKAISGGSVYWQFMSNGTAANTWWAINSGGGEPSGQGTGNNTSIPYTIGGLSVLGFRLDRTAADIRAIVNSTISSAVSASSLGAISSPSSFRVGASGGTNYQDTEVYAVAVFRQALTASQIRQISNYFANREVYL